MKNLEEIYSELRKVGFLYAKYMYDDWADNYADELLDSSSYYYDSLAENGSPKQDIFQSQVMEQSWQTYLDGDFELENISEDESKLIEEEYWYDYIVEGITKFINQTYL